MSRARAFVSAVCLAILVGCGGGGGNNGGNNGGGGGGGGGGVAGAAATGGGGGAGVVAGAFLPQLAATNNIADRPITEPTCRARIIVTLLRVVAAYKVDC